MTPRRPDSTPCPRCWRRHRFWYTLARCLVPGTAWVTGEGPFASVSWCRMMPTVMLYRTRAAAEEGKRFIDRTGCGSRCGRTLHEVRDLAEWAAEDYEGSQF